MGAVVIKMSDRRPPQGKSPRKPRRNKNDPLQSPLVQGVCVMLQAGIERAEAMRQDPRFTEEQKTLAAGFAAGLSEAVDYVEHVAIQLATKVSV